MHLAILLLCYQLGVEIGVTHQNCLEICVLQHKKCTTCCRSHRWGAQLRITVQQRNFTETFALRELCDFLARHEYVKLPFFHPGRSQSKATVQMKRGCVEWYCVRQRRRTVSVNCQFAAAHGNNTYQNMQSPCVPCSHTTVNAGTESSVTRRDKSHCSEPICLDWSPANHVLLLK